MRYGLGGILAAGSLVAASVVAQPVARAAEPFTLTSPAYQDDAALEIKNTGDAKEFPSCVGGANLSPPLAWSNAPDGTKGFALTMVDVEGASGAGNVHLVAYGIGPTVTSFAEGELSQPSEKFVGGKNFRGIGTYFGPCPPASVGWHHYALIIIATDLDPTALQPGMTRDELLAALKGHVKGTAGLIVRFRHP